MSSLSRAVLLVCSLGNVAALLVVVSPPGYCCSRLIVAGTQWILIKRIKGWISFCSVRLLLCDWTGCHCVPCYPHGHDESLESTRRRKTPADYFSVVWWKFFFLPVNINDLNWFYSCCDVEAPSSSEMNLWSGSDQHLSSAAVSSARWGLGGNCLWETGEQVILTPCGRWGAVKILLPGFPSTDRLTFKRAVKSFTMFRPLKSDVKY